MFILDPINSITSVQFYKKVSAQSAARTAGYLSYLGLVFAVLATAAFKARLGPSIDSTFLWLQAQTPTLVFAGGKVSSPGLDGPKTLRHPTISELALQIDTARVEPVTVQVMEQLQVNGYLASNALYLLDPQGQLKVSDLSKGAASGKTIRIDADFFRSAQALLAKALYPAMLAATFGLFLIWKGLSSLFYSLVAMAVNAIADAKLSYQALLNIAVYAQTLIIAIQAIFLFMKAPLPLASLVSLAATTGYIWLAVRANSPADASDE